jgi:hypothetical protein
MMKTINWAEIAVATLPPAHAVAVLKDILKSDLPATTKEEIQKKIEDLEKKK